MESPTAFKEKYQIITQGLLAKGFTEANVRQNLQQHLRLNKATTDKLFSGARIKLKSQLDWKQAQVWQKKLFQLGLQSELAVQFNPECLQAGLTPAWAEDTSAEPVIPVRSMIQFDRKKITPTIINFAGTQSLISGKRQTAAKMVSSFAYCNPLVLILTCMFLGLTLQSYVLRVMTFYFNLSTTATAGGIAFMALVIICLPRLLQPRQLDSFSDRDDKYQVTMLESSVFRLGTKKHDLFDDSGNLISTIRHDSKQASLTNPEGQCLYRWEQHLKVSESSQDVAAEFRDQLVDDTDVGTLSDYLSYLRNFIRFFKRKRQRTALKAGIGQWEHDSMRPIVNDQKQPVALVYLQPAPAIKLLNPELSPSDQLQLLAFSSVLLRSPWA